MKNVSVLFSKISKKIKIFGLVLSLIIIALTANYIYECNHIKYYSARQFIIDYKGDDISENEMSQFYIALSDSKLFPECGWQYFIIEKANDKLFLNLKYNPKMDMNIATLKMFKDELQSLIPNIEFDLNIVEKITGNIICIIC